MSFFTRLPFFYLALSFLAELLFLSTFISSVSTSPFCLVFNSVSPFPCIPFFPRTPPPLYTAAPIHSSSAPTLVLGQVADQLAYYIHVSATAITEETFDAAVVWRSAGRPHPAAEWDDLFACPATHLGLPSAPTGKVASKTTTPPTCVPLSSPASQVGRERDGSASDCSELLL